MELSFEVKTGSSGYQEVEYEDMKVIGKRDHKKRSQMPMESIYEPVAGERKLTEGRSVSMEDMEVYGGDMRPQSSKEEPRPRG